MIECAECGERFENLSRRYRKYCSASCKGRAWRRDHPGVNAANAREWNRKNSEKLAARSREWYRGNLERAATNNRVWREANPEQYSANHRRRTATRRARMADAFVEHVDPRIVFDRSEGTCGICHESVDPSDFHVDHIRPLSRGGEHSYANTQVAHPLCNTRKGASLPGIFSPRSGN